MDMMFKPLSEKMASSELLFNLCGLVTWWLNYYIKGEKL
jgi:hypothetical protein